MPRITGEFVIPGAPKQAIGELRNTCKAILRAGTTAWVEEVKEIVPNWSGMSRASLKPIADFVNVPIFPLGPTEAGVPDRVSAGKALGEAKMKNGPTEFFFEWKSQVFHFVYNESNNANNVGFRLRNPGPYESQRKAAKAFFEVVNPQLRKLGSDINIRAIRRIRI